MVRQIIKVAILAAVVVTVVLLIQNMVGMGV